jgi:hypothetical protein
MCPQLLEAKERLTFFRDRLEEEENRTCCDGGEGEAEWASISHGTYISIAAAGVHRSLGVEVSFVQSTTMDSWKPLHLRMMELGGNRRFKDFLREHGIPEDLPIREKYTTRAAAWYREHLRAVAESAEPPPPLPPGTGHLPANVDASPSHRVLNRVFAETGAAMPSMGGSPRRESSWSGVGSPRKEASCQTSMRCEELDDATASEQLEEDPSGVCQLVCRSLRGALSFGEARALIKGKDVRTTDAKAGDVIGSPAGLAKESPASLAVVALASAALRAF